MADTTMSYDDLQSYLTGSVINPTYDSSKHRLIDYGMPVFAGTASKEEVIAFATMLVTAYPDDENVVAYAAAELDRRGIKMPLDPTDSAKGTYPDNATFVNEIREGAKIERAFVETRGTGYTYDARATYPSVVYTDINDMNVAEYITTKKPYETFAHAVADFAIQGSCMPATDGTPSPVQLYMQAAMAYELLLHSKKASDLTDADKKQLEAIAHDMDVCGKELDKLGISRSKVHGYIATHVRDLARDKGKPLYDGNRELTAEELEDANIKEKGLFDRYNVNRAQYNELYLKSLEAADNTARMDRLNKYPGFRRMVWEYQQQLASGKAPFVNPFLSAMLVESREETPTAPTAGGATATATGGAGGSVTVGDVIINGGSGGTTTRGARAAARRDLPREITGALTDIRTANSLYESKLGTAAHIDDDAKRNSRIVGSTAARNVRVANRIGEIFAYAEAHPDKIDEINELLEKAYPECTIAKDDKGQVVVTVDGEKYTHDGDHTKLEVIPEKMTETQCTAVVDNIFIAPETRMEIIESYKEEHGAVPEHIAGIDSKDQLRTDSYTAADGSTAEYSSEMSATRKATANKLANNTAMAGPSESI